MVHAVGQLGLMRDLDQPRVVDAGGLRWRRGGFGFGLGMSVMPEVVRDRQAHRRAGQTHLDACVVERVEHQLDLAADQRRVDLVAVAC